MAVYLTGDKHGDYAAIKHFCKEQHTAKDADVMIVLGDHGTRFYPDDDERTLKTLDMLEALPIRFVMIRGNHDRRLTIRSRHVVYKYVNYGNGVSGNFLR